MEYIDHDAVCGRHWGALYREFAAFLPVLCNARGVVVAVGFAIPLTWSGRVRDLPSDVDGALERGVRGRAKGRAPNALSALLAVVAPGRQGGGLSARVIRAMSVVAVGHGIDGPDRAGAAYPQAPVSDGADASLRALETDGRRALRSVAPRPLAAGAKLLCVAARSMVVTGTVAEWESWTAMSFPESGRYIIPGALAPVTIDRRRNRGRYVEPNVWMRHPSRGKRDDVQHVRLRSHPQAVRIGDRRGLRGMDAVAGG
jgi:hypothetical protein